MSLINHNDIPVYIGINAEGVYILDHVENVIYTKYYQIINLKFMYLFIIYLF